MPGKTRKTIASVAVLATLGLGGATYVQASGRDDEGASGPAAKSATAAALKVTGGGEVNAVERDSEKGATWEVEITKRDGSTVDVRLGAKYETVAVDSDSEDSGEE